MSQKLEDALCDVFGKGMWAYRDEYTSFLIASGLQLSMLCRTSYLYKLLCGEAGDAEPPHAKSAPSTTNGDGMGKSCY